MKLQDATFSVSTSPPHGTGQSRKRLSTNAALSFPKNPIGGRSCRYAVGTRHLSNTIVRDWTYAPAFKRQMYVPLARPLAKKVS